MNYFYHKVVEKLLELKKNLPSFGRSPKNLMFITSKLLQKDGALLLNTYSYSVIGVHCSIFMAFIGRFLLEESYQQPCQCFTLVCQSLVDPATASNGS